MAAARSTLRAPRSSSSVSRLRDSIAASARREALNSTGSVASWNTVTRPKSRMPAQTSTDQLKISPAMSSGHDRFEPMRVAGMMAARMRMGA